MTERHRTSATTTLLLAALALLAAYGLLVRLPTIAEPLAMDQSLWASMAKGLARGQLLYRDVWDHKPPGIVLVYLAAFKTFGWTAGSIAWLDVLASSTAVLLLFLIGTKLAGRVPGAAAAAIYAVLTVPCWIYRHGGFIERSIAETFVVVCVGVAAWCAARLVDRLRLVPAIGLGLAVGVAVVFKPNALVYLPFLLAWVACFAVRAEDWSWRAFARVGVVSSAAVLVAPGLTLLWLWMAGVFPEAWNALVDFNRMYVSGGFTLRRFVLDFAAVVWLQVKSDPLWMLGTIATLVAMWHFARHRRLDALSGLGILWGGAAALAVIANGARLYDTYFLQALAPLALMAAWLLTDAPRRSKVARVAAVGAGVLLVTVLVRHDYAGAVYRFTSLDLDHLRGRDNPLAYLDTFGGYANERGYSARANAELAAFVRDHTGPDDRIYLFGINGAGVYFASDRLTAHRFLRVNFYVPGDFPDPRFRLSAVTRELESSRPTYLIFEQLHSPSVMGRAVDALQQAPDIVRLLQGYRLEKQIEDFTLYRRTDARP